MNSRQRKTSLEAKKAQYYNGACEALPNRQPSEEEWEESRRIARTTALAQVGATINVRAEHFVLALEQMQEQIYTAMLTNGFWNGNQDNFGQKVALVHSELSEMLEANRKRVEADDKVPDFTGEEAEAADTIIRLLDMAGRYNWRLGEAVVAKMLFNLTRPHKHGKEY